MVWYTVYLIDEFYLIFLISQDEIIVSQSVRNCSENKARQTITTLIECQKSGEFWMCNEGQRNCVSERKRKNSKTQLNWRHKLFFIFDAIFDLSNKNSKLVFSRHVTRPIKNIPFIRWPKSTSKSPTFPFTKSMVTISFFKVICNI